MCSDRRLSKCWFVLYPFRPFVDQFDGKWYVYTNSKKYNYLYYLLNRFSIFLGTRECFIAWNCLPTGVAEVLRQQVLKVSKNAIWAFSVKIHTFVQVYWRFDITVWCKFSPFKNCKESGIVGVEDALKHQICVWVYHDRNLSLAIIARLLRM